MKGWLSKLEESGFCYNTLKSIESRCADALAKHDVSDSDRIIVYIIESVCFWVADHLDDGPVDKQAHDRIEAIMLSPLRETISLIGSQNLEGKIEAASRLVLASQQARRVRLHS